MKYIQFSCNFKINLRLFCKKTIQINSKQTVYEYEMYNFYTQDLKTNRIHNYKQQYQIFEPAATSGKTSRL